jgi:hypothetical protein
VTGVNTEALRQLAEAALARQHTNQEIGTGPKIVLELLDLMDLQSAEIRELREERDARNREDAVHRAFYDLTVKQRDHAWEESAGRQAEVVRLQRVIREVEAFTFGLENPGGNPNHLVSRERVAQRLRAAFGEES